jgi:ABC-type multidrug transport system permease subunit
VTTRDDRVDRPFRERAAPGTGTLTRRLAVAHGVAWRTLHNIFTNPSLFIPGLVFPLFFFTAFAGGLSRIGNVPGFDYPNGYTAFQFSFVLIQSAAFGGVFTGFGIARDFESGFARRLLLAAPHRSGIVLGYAVAALGRWLVTAAFITCVALAVGMQVGGSLPDLAAMYLLGFLVNAAALLFACGVAMRFRTMQAGPVMQFPVFIVLFFAPVYVPLGLLQGWIRGVATVNPLTRILEAVRGLLAGSPTETGFAFLAAVLVLAAFVPWALRGLRSAERAG